MNHKVKSFLYFASLVLAVVMYYTVENAGNVQNTALAKNIIEQVSSPEALN